MPPGRNNSDHLIFDNLTFLRFPSFQGKNTVLVEEGGMKRERDWGGGVWGNWGVEL